MTAGAKTSTLLSGYGPRVQFSVVECEVRTRHEATTLRATLRNLIDPIEDEVRIYGLDDRAACGVIVIGARVIEVARTSGSCREPVHDQPRRLFSASVGARIEPGRRHDLRSTIEKPCQTASPM